MQRPAFWMALALVPALIGCNYRGYQASMAGPEYPFGEHTTNTAQVQVFRDGTTISIVNSTASRWGPSRMWLNQRFSRSIGFLNAGETLNLDLHSFWDEDGESYPGGGFLSTRPSMPVRLIEIEPVSDEPMIGLVSIPMTGEN